MDRKASTPIFTVALFTIAYMWKHPECPPKNKCVKKMWYIHTMENASAFEKEILQYATIWTNFENIKLSEISQSQKKVLQPFHLYEAWKVRSQIQESKEWNSSGQALEEGECGVIINRHKVSVKQDGQALEICCTALCTPSQQ